MSLLINTDFTYKVVLKKVQNIDDHFNSIILTQFFKNWSNLFFYFFSCFITKDGKQDYG